MKHLDSILIIAAMLVDMKQGFHFELALVSCILAIVAVSSFISKGCASDVDKMSSLKT